MSSIVCATSKARGPSERARMRPEIRFHPLAEEDLDAIDDFVALHSPSGARHLVERVERVENAVERLSRFPDSGRRRDDLAAGIRTLAIDRTLLLAYRIEHDHIVILRIFYAGRDFDGDLREDSLEPL
ncbi:possible plasmid stabilisation system protein [Aurantimonas manganoxydans SI85-9A1]|uniref:Possible plasmid stabilisation system protein n=2 Tax=Aurantimonas manganoxydans TaxID=651183 RepID=Q1YF40_AURMS|nr:possible plasmid stabilisation system protein [Aurantimonas manganoxydans SI85-9A1]